MDITKIKNYDKISPIFTTGKLTPESVVAQGTAPSTVGFVAEAEELETSPPSRRSG